MVRELSALPRKEKSAGPKEREVGTRQVFRLRLAGRLPAVLYGGDLKGPQSLSLDEHEFLKVVKAGERVVTLALPSGPVQTLIKALQYDHLGEKLLHVDFVALRAGEKVRVRIPLATKGVPKGHADGGLLHQMLHMLEVECMPTAIPEKLVVDVEPLALDDYLHVSDLKLPEGVVALTKGTDMVAACLEPRKEEEVVAAAPAEGAPLEPEVLAEKKKEGEGEGEGAAPAAEGKKPAEPKKKEGKEGR